MKRFSQCLMLSVALVAFAAVAQEQNPEVVIFPQAAEPVRITPAGADAQNDAILSTKPVAPRAAAPIQNSPFQRAESAGAQPPQAGQAPAQFQPKIPFGRGEAASSGPVIPSGPHTTISVPVVDVDAIEAAEPAPPTPPPPGADPVQENPADPTELTSPIFETEVGAQPARVIVIRALNKVTAQSETLRLKPNEMVKFGQLEITAVMCRVSSPTSQTDYAALLDISEVMPKAAEPKKHVFRGWMYASSPSITSLEHPIYDVMMVECASPPAAKKEEKEEKKPAKKGKH